MKLPGEESLCKEQALAEDWDHATENIIGSVQVLKWKLSYLFTRGMRLKQAISGAPLEYPSTGARRIKAFQTSSSKTLRKAIKTKEFEIKNHLR